MTLCVWCIGKNQKRKSIPTGNGVVTSIALQRFNGCPTQILLMSRNIFAEKIRMFGTDCTIVEHCLKLGAHNENVTCIKFFHLWSISNPCWWFVLIYMLMIINVARWGVGNYSAERKERGKNNVLLLVAWEVFSNEMDGESSFDIIQALINS